METIMKILENKDVKLDAKNHNGKTFLELSPVQSKLLQKIQTATDEWAENVFRACVENPMVIERWVNLGDDSLLQAIFDRMRKSLQDNLYGCQFKIRN